VGLIVADVFLVLAGLFQAWILFLPGLSQWQAPAPLGRVVVTLFVLRVGVIAILHIATWVISFKKMWK
jgi:hypothetical protein